MSAAQATHGDSASQQTWTAAGYERNARFVSDLGAEILGWLDPQPGEHILDLGCGDGALTCKLVAAGANVIGVDTSEDLLHAARARGLDARHMDGHHLTFDAAFDAVFSNAALHWMTRPDEVIGGIKRALKPGGRFVAEFGGHGNVSAIVTAMRSAARAFDGDDSLAGPWFYPTADDYAQMLTRNGFNVRRTGLFYRPTTLTTGLDGWLVTFRKAFFDQFDASGKRGAAVSHITDLLEPVLRDQQGRWVADYVRLRVEATV